MYISKQIILSFVALFFIHTCTLAQNTFQRSYGGTSSETNEAANLGSRFINTTYDQGFAVCHSTKSYGYQSSQGIYFLRLDKQGDTLFTKVFYRTDGPCYGRSVHQTPDRGLSRHRGL